MSKSTLGKVAGVSVGAAALIAAAGMPAHSAPQEQETKRAAFELPDSLVDLSVAVDHLLPEERAWPQVPHDLAIWASDLMDQFADHPQFHDVGINEDQSAVTVWWHGDETAELTDALGTWTTDFGAEIDVEQTAYSVAELEAATERLFADETLGVSYTSIRPDGSGIDVEFSFAETAASQGRSAQSPETGIEQIAGVPVAVEERENIHFQNRTTDTYRIGGARIARWEAPNVTGMCSSGFALQNTSSARGMLTAAHCGPTGSTWGVLDENAGTIGIIGGVTVSWPFWDQAIIGNSTVQPFIYAGPWNGTQITSIQGSIDPMIGSYICYSGSYTGLQCGNEVVSKAATQSDLPGNVTADGLLRTVRADGTIVAGQGDSGGPGYQVTTNGGITWRWAAATITGGPLGQIQLGNCPGREANRSCGAVVNSGSVHRLVQQTGWSILGTAPTVPSS